VAAGRACVREEIDSTVMRKCVPCVCVRPRGQTSLYSKLLPCVDVCVCVCIADEECFHDVGERVTILHDDYTWYGVIHSTNSSNFPIGLFTHF